MEPQSRDDRGEAETGSRWDVYYGKGWKMGMKSYEKWIKMVEHEDLSWISW